MLAPSQRGAAHGGFVGVGLGVGGGVVGVAVTVVGVARGGVVDVGVGPHWGFVTNTPFWQYTPPGAGHMPVYSPSPKHWPESPMLAPSQRGATHI
jgi:hypothetical protein